MLIIHLGLVEVVADGLRLLGFQPSSLFDRPFLSSSLSEFWGKRWNKAFVDMNKLFILSPLKGRVANSLIVFSIFVVSGILHELAISYADGVSWGLPLLYFCIQGIGVLLERKFPLNRAFVISWILLPVPLLFTPTFTNLFLGSLCSYIFNFVSSFDSQEMIKLGLIGGVIMHLMVLGASLQVPHRLNWNTAVRRKFLSRAV